MESAVGELPPAPGGDLPRALSAAVLIPAALVIAGLSLIAARTPTFDVWAWLVWGREIGHLNLQTSGPQFKPLPVLIGALSSPFGDAEVPIWLLAARTAGLLAVGGVARLAWRSAGPFAAVIAGVSLLSNHLFCVYLMPYGMSEPMGLAFMIWAADRYFAGRHRLALSLVFGAALLRPEAWPFLLVYAVWLYRGRTVSRAFITGVLILVPAMWLLPEWWGSGNPFRGGGGIAVAGNPTTKAVPGLAVLSSSFDGILTWVWAGALIGLAFAIRARDRLLRPLAGLAVAWLVVVAVATQANLSSGVSRYLIVTHGVACILCGTGYVNAIRFVRSHFRAPLLAASVAGVAIAALAIPSALTYDGWLRDGIADVRHQSRVHAATVRAVTGAGGRDALNHCGAVIWTRTYRETEVAWILHRHLAQVSSLIVPGLPTDWYQSPLIQIVDRPGDSLAPVPIEGITYRTTTRAVVGGVPTVVLDPC